MSDLSVLHDMTLFVEVARAKNFSAASRRLDVPVATVSRRIAAMERDFGVRLFDRTTRRVELTEAGARYFERCEHLADEARLAQEALRAIANQPRGVIRVSMPTDFGVDIIGPLLPEFARRFPGIRFDLDLSSRVVDVAADPVDLAIRLGPIGDDKLIARPLGAIERTLYASDAYLDRRGRPTSPAELAQHDCILQRTRPPVAQARWRLSRGDESVDAAVHGRFAVNSVGLMQVLAARGMGIAMLTESMLRRDLTAGARLERVLPGWVAPPMPIHALVATRLQPAAVKAFLDYLRSKLNP